MTAPTETANSKPSALLGAWVSGACTVIAGSCLFVGEWTGLLVSGLLAALYGGGSVWVWRRGSPS